MAIKLSTNSYGKSRVRLVRITRGSEQHHLKDVSVDIQFEGDFEAVHVRGDNRNVLPTDTMKNTVYALASQQPVGEIEEFGLRLASYFMENNPQVRNVRIALSERQWARIPVEGQPHPWAFVAGRPDRRTALVSGTRAGNSVQAGIEDLLVLKSNESAFAGYIQDRFTTLPETHDRIFATVVKANWSYGHLDVAFGRCWEGARSVLLETFAQHRSESVQHTLYAMAGAVLDAFGEIDAIRLSMPNKHHTPVDLTPFGMESLNEVFVATEEPFGLIEAVVRRDSGFQF
jgi:urate oxidase